jgi:tetratricopeptide (TPR) repeat protein
MKNTLRAILVIGLTFSIALLNGCTDSNLKKGRNYQKQKDYEQAIHYFTLALEKDPENTSARYALVETYALKLIEENKEQPAPETIEQSMTELLPIAEPLMKDPNVKRYISLIYQTLAKVYGEQGEHEKAAAAWAEVINIEPYLAEGYYNLGVAKAKLKQDEEAIKHFEKAVELNPYFIKGYYAMGNSLMHLKRDKEAVVQYSKALEINPDDPEVRHNLGVAYSRAGQKEKAIEELEKTIELEPGYMLAYMSLAGIYSKSGEKEKAEEVNKRWRTYAETYLETPEEGTASATPDASAEDTES